MGELFNPPLQLLKLEMGSNYWNDALKHSFLKYSKVNFILKVKN